MQQVLHENGSIINGDGKIVFGKRCSVSGNNTKVFGDFCQISGDNVVNSGNYSQISGDHVRNDGTGCVIRGDHIKNYGKRCQLRGDNIKNMGDDCLLSGDNITNYGANCVFAGGRNFTDMSHHKMKYLPPWKSRKNQEVTDMLLRDQATTIARESMGVVSDEGRKETPTSVRRVGAIGTSCIDVGVVGSVRGYDNVISGSGGCAVAVCGSGSGSVSAAASASGDNVDVSSVTAVNGVAIGTNYGKLLNTFGVSKSSAAIPKKTVITNKITRSGVSINVESQGSSVLTISDDDDDDDDDDDGPKIVRFDLDSVLIKGKHLPTMNIGTCKAGTDVTVQGFRIVSLRDISVKTIKEGILISGLTDEEVDLLLSQ